MKKSKSKTRQPSPPRYFAAVHQDALMDAFARGFVAPRPGGLEAESLVTPAAIARAMGEAEWGDVVLLEVAPPSQEKDAVGLSQPLLLTDVIGCWTRTADVAAEIDARLETFDDTVPGIVEIAADPALFPEEQAVASQDSLPLGLDAGDLQTDAPTEASTLRDAVALEKIAGGLSMLRSRAKTGALGFDSLARLLAMSSSDWSARDGGVASLASHVYRALRPGQDETGDERIFVNAAMGLKDSFPKQGLDPIAFVELLGDREDLAAFLETLRKVLDNRIELSDSKLDDSGRVGQRALLVFLLAPRAEELERWLQARPVGPTVAALASLLSGIYCGLGNIPRDLKGPAPDPLLAIVQAASSVVDGLPPQVRVDRFWDSKAALHECIEIGTRKLLVKTTQPPEPLASILAAAREAGFDANVARDSGECIVLAGEGTTIKLAVAKSAFRVPPTQVAQLAFYGRGAKRGQPSRELLAALLDESLRPVVSTIDASGLVRLEVELDDLGSMSLGISQLLRVVDSVGLIQEKAAGGQRRTKKI